jgi:hypothetical protein
MLSQQTYRLYAGLFSVELRTSSPNGSISGE